MANIFDINFQTQINNLLPRTKRLPKILSYLYSLVYPIQWVRDLLLDSYKNGTTYSAWSNVSGYAIGARVRFTDNSVYECNNPGGAFGNTQSPINTLYWLKIQENFIGTDERVKYSAQIITFEYALNRWFNNPQPNPQIYITTTATSSQFVMGQTSTYSSAMANNGFSSTTFMGNAYVPTQYDFIIYFPIGLFNSLPPALNTDKEKLIRNFADKYKLAGTLYVIVTF